MNRNGFLFPVSVPSKEVLLSMKLSALLARGKGRDFYDTIFLWQQVQPDYGFLRQRCGIGSPEELKAVLTARLAETNLAEKQKDFEHLLFTGRQSAKILYFGELL